MVDRKEIMIEDVKEESPDVRTFIFNKSVEGAEPGNFVMFGLMDGGEKPFSLVRENAVTVKKMPRTNLDVPTFTERMFDLKNEDMIYVRGPLGNGFEIFHNHDYVMIGGGIGLAPLMFASRECFSSNSSVSVFAGGRTKEDIIFPEEFGVYARGRFHTATEDGSEGYEGTVVDLMKSKAEELKNLSSEYLVCGPEKMIVAVAEQLEDFGIEANNIQASIERYMKCGMGLCGACSIGGYRTCVDGPVFAYDALKKNKHFGKLKREKSGSLTDI